MLKKGYSHLKILIYLKFVNYTNVINLLCKSSVVCNDIEVLAIDTLRLASHVDVGLV